MVEIPLSWFASQNIQLGEKIVIEVTDYGIRVKRCYRVVTIDHVNQIASCVEVE